MAVNISDVKTIYTPTEWATRENEYVTAINQIELPDGIDTSSIKFLESEMDHIYTKAALDYAYINRKYQRLERSRKALEKELFLLIKSQTIQGLKTVDEIGGAVSMITKVIPAQDVLQQKPIDPQLITYTLCNLMNVPLPSTCTYVPSVPQKQSLIQAIYIVEERLLFLDQIIDILKTKHEKLITDTGILKLEAGIGPQGV